MLGDLTIYDYSVETNEINNIVIQGNLYVYAIASATTSLTRLAPKSTDTTEINNYTDPTVHPPVIPDQLPAATPTRASPTASFEGLTVKDSTAAPGANH